MSAMTGAERAGNSVCAAFKCCWATCLLSRRSSTNARNRLCRQVATVAPADLSNVETPVSKPSGADIHVLYGFGQDGLVPDALYFEANHRGFI